MHEHSDSGYYSLVAAAARSLLLAGTQHFI